MWAMMTVRSNARTTPLQGGALLPYVQHAMPFTLSFQNFQTFETPLRFCLPSIFSCAIYYFFIGYSATARFTPLAKSPPKGVTLTFFDLP